MSETIHGPFISGVVSDVSAHRAQRMRWESELWCGHASAIRVGCPARFDNWPSIFCREEELLSHSARIFPARSAAVFLLTAAASFPFVADAVAQPVHPNARAAPAARPVARPAPVARPVVRAAPVARPVVRAAPVAPRVNTQVRVNRQVQVNPNTTPRLDRRGFTAPGNPNPNVIRPNLAPNAFHPNVAPNVNALKLGPGHPVVSPLKANLQAGPRGVMPVRPAFPHVAAHNKFWPIYRGPHFIYMGGFRRFFVPVGILGVALIGGSYWYPDAYVSVGQPFCSGVSENGCTLHWRMVDFADGGAEPQCVQYCPRVGPPPPTFVELPPPPPPPPDNASCQLTIFADQNFAGLSAPTGDAQADLAETGWQNEIASIQIRSGTWDFFTDPNFGGATMRLPAGPYPTLSPDWTKKIGSFQCVQPGAGA
jgi:hypothetical protein